MTKIAEEEIWKPLIYKGQHTNYSISSLGRVRNDKSGRILKQFIQNNGYYGFTISINNKPHSMKTARMVAETFIPNPDPINKTEVNHKKSKKNNSISNLEWVSPFENKMDARRNHLYKGQDGETNWNSIYTNKQIEKVCKLLEENKLDINQLVNKTGVSKETISDIYHGDRWRSISKNYFVKNYDKLPINSSKKFTKDQIYNACILIDKGLKNKEIMSIIGISKDCIKRLRAGKTYKDIAKDFKFFKKLL